MSENRRTWEEKLKLSLNVLERKINTQNTEKTGRRESLGGNRAASKKKYETKAQWKKAVFRQEILIQAVKSAAFLLATIALIQGIVKVLPASITVSNTVNGRELPIYCVKTEKPQVALSFDAAWGNEDTAKILEILRNHNVKVTFFMTGGWVLG